MYEDHLLQLSRDTRFRRAEPLPHPLSERRNPACGDEVALGGTLTGGTVENLHFHAQGCAVCTASCSALCQEVEGCSVEEAGRRIAEALAFFDSDGEWDGEWGKQNLPALGAVRARPMRMTCVKLAWLALRDAL